MPNTVMHCFDPDKAEAEGKLIGSLLAGYGELELEMALCLSAATEDLDNALKTLFCIRGEKHRIDVADSNMRATYEKAGLDTVYSETMSDMDWCRKIRNQYAHCVWYHTDALYLVNLEQIANAAPPILPLEPHKVRVGVPILQTQMDFFIYTRKNFWYLAEQCSRYRFIVRNPREPLSGAIHRLPVVVARPPLHL